MSDLNGFRAYEAAIISGMLASDYSPKAIRDNFSEIRKTARLFSGSVSDVYYPTGVCFTMADAARSALYHFLSSPKPLAAALSHMYALGFEERVTRYVISANTGAYADAFDVDVIDGVPMLSREART